VKATVLRWLLGAVLVWAALGKVANPQEFFTALRGYHLPLPAWCLHATAAVLPWLELLCGLLLLANLRTRAAAAWAVILLAIFALATGQAWARGLDLDCGCLNLHWLGIEPGSPQEKWLGSAPVACVRALVLLGVGIVVLRGGRGGGAGEGEVAQTMQHSGSR
jgi:uncharacterized membrane protein YphA (DoxX/SURF4 family)